MTSYTRGFEVLRVGALGAIAFVVFGALFLYATNRRLTREHADLHLSFPSAEGLKKGDAVLFHGVQVGEVRRIAFGVEGVLVQARITERFGLRRGARAYLVAADIFGRQSVVLRQGSEPGVVQDGDTIAGAPAGSLTARLDDLGMRVGRVVGDTTVMMLHRALAGIGGASVEVGSLAAAAQATLTDQRRALGTASGAAARLAMELDSVVDVAAMTRIRGNIETSTAALTGAAARADTATAALNRILARVERGDGAAARLLNDPALYDNAAAALASLDALLRDVRRNPGRYVHVSVF